MTGLLAGFAYVQLTRCHLPDEIGLKHLQCIAVTFHYATPLEQLKDAGHGFPAGVDHDGQFLVGGGVGNERLGALCFPHQFQLSAHPLQRVRQTQNSPVGSVLA